MEKLMEEKKPIVYLDYLPADLRSIFSENKDAMLTYLKENMMVYYESQRYDKITKEVLPALSAALKLYKPPKETKTLFIELLAKAIFQPTRELLPSELTELVGAIQPLLKGKIKGHFALNWEPVLQFLETFFNKERREAYHIPKKDDANLKIIIPKFIQKLKRFFPVESGNQIFKYVKSFIGPSQARENFYLYYLHCLLRTDHKVPKEHYEDWMKEMLVLWECNSSKRAFGSAALSLFSGLARAHYEIDWEPYIDTLFTHIMNTIPHQTKEGEFLINLNNVTGLIAPEENLCRKVVNYAAKLAVSLLKPHPEGKSKALNCINDCLIMMKPALYPSQRTAHIGFTESKFLQSLLFNMCTRLKLERHCKNIKEESKLKEIDVRQFVDLIIRTLDPTLLNLTKSQNVSTALSLISYLYPEKAFDHYIPQLLKLLDDYNIPHNPALSYLNSIVKPLLFHPDFPRKYFYLSLILDYAIREVITVGSENNLLALEIVSQIFYFLPLPHQRCLEDAYKVVAKRNGSSVEYETYLYNKRKSNECEYYYHETLNVFENKVCDVLTRMFAMLEVKEKPSKKELDQGFMQKVQEIGSALCTNSTNELFEVLMDQFKTFITSEAYPNAFKEVAVLIKHFVKRDPVAVSKTIIPYVFQALVSKEPDPKIWDAGVGQYVKSAMPGYYEVAHKYSLNKYVPVEKFKYYTGILCNLLINNPEAYKQFKDCVNTLLVLLLLDADKNKNKETGQLLYSILLGQLSRHWTTKIITQQSRWESEEKILESYKTVGQYDPSMLELVWGCYTKEGLEVCRELIQKLGFGLGEYAMEAISKNPGPESNAIVKNWLQVVSKVVPGCLSLMQKEGDKPFSIIGALLRKVTGEDKALAEFFFSLRPRLLSLASEITAKLSPAFSEQMTQKLAKKTMYALLSIIGLFYDFKQLIKAAHLHFVRLDKNMYRNPTIKDYPRKYTYYYEKLNGLPQTISKCFEKDYEVPSAELRTAIHHFLDTLGHVPNLVTLLTLLTDYQSTGFQFKIMQVIKNIHNPSEDFFEELFLKNYAQARSLLEFIAKSPSKESVEEKTFGWYMGVVRQVLTMSPKLPFKKDYLSKLIIKDILEFILSIDKPGLLTIPMVLLYTIEELVQIPVHKKRFSGAVKAEAMDHISGVSVKEREEIQVKYKDKIETLYKEKQDAKMMKIAKIKELLEELMGKAAIIAQENGNGSVTNIKNECMVMALLSLLIGHFENAPEALIKLANSLVGSLTGGANYSRAFAAARITEILTLRQRQLVKPTYIYKHEYSDNQPLAKEDSPARFASITLTPELLYSKGLSEGNILYIDKAGFGWIDIPPYLRFYKGNIGFAVLPPELQKIDLLGELLNTPEYVAKLLNQAMSGHEVKEEQRLMKEGEESKSKLDFIIKAFLSRQFGSDDQFSQIFSMLHNESYAIKTKFFNPNEAVFYQSCFEFYGPAPMKHFAAVIDEMLAKGKSTAVLASSLEVLCGFLRASKVFEEASTEHLKDYCYDTILKVIKVAPLEFLEDINETLLFFLSGRDPKRWTVFWKKLMAELSPNESSGTFERTKFFSCINCLLGAWLWRSKALSEEYIKWYIKNMIQDTEKLCTLAGGNLCLVLYKAFDYLKFDPNSIKVVEVAKCPYQKDLEAVVKKFVDEITDTELPKEEHRLRSIKLSLVQILSQARSHEKNRDQSQQWIIETLAPLCYRLSVFLSLLKNRLTRIK
eukprot:TRINITY_DN2739_c0_g1_i1.p1 TRINITY_DN2739_c0_g1~~TRINITY_DN2739_c0_g1_i1.p1  ORF type:complete len:1715 (-),score=212.94 TRINITY_DN2739_c0_g1_i1:5488-10632(-)